MIIWKPYVSCVILMPILLLTGCSGHKGNSADDIMIPTKESLPIVNSTKASTFSKGQSREARGIEGIVVASPPKPTDAPKGASTEPQHIESPTEMKQAEFTVQLGHDGLVLGATLSVDGNDLYSVDGSEIKTWEVSTGRVIRSVMFDSLESSSAIAFSADGTKCVLGSSVATELRETASGRLIRSFVNQSGDATSPAQSNGSYSVDLSHDGKYVVSNNRCIWNAESGELVCRLQERQPVYKVKFSPDGKCVAGHVDLRNMDGIEIVRTWDASTGQAIRTFRGNEPELGWRDLCISPNGQYLMAGGKGAGAVCLWDVATGAPLPVCTVRERLGTIVAFSPDGKLALTGGRGTGIKDEPHDDAPLVWDVATGRLIWRLGEHPNLRMLSFTRDGKYAMSAGDRSVKLWDLSTGRMSRVYEGLRFKDFTRSAFSPDGNYLMLGGDNENTKLLRAEAGEILQRSEEPSGKVPIIEGYEPPDSAVRTITFSRDGRQVLLGGGGEQWPDIGYLLLADVESGGVKLRFDLVSACIISAAFCTDAKRVVGIEAGLTEDSLCWWDISTGKKLSNRKFGDSGFLYSKLSPDGRYIFSHRYIDEKTDRIELADAGSGEPIGILENPHFRVRGAVFSCDASTVLMESEKRQMALFDTRSMNIIQRYPAQTKQIFSLFFGPQGKSVLMGTAAKTFVYDTASGQELSSFPDCAVAISNSNRPLLVTFSKEATADIWDFSSGTLLYTLLVDMVEDEYLTWSPEGYYRGSNYAVRNLVHIVRGTETFGIDQFFDRFYNPAMVQAKIMGYKVDAPRLDTVLASSPPPFVEITSPKMSADGKITNADGSTATLGEAKVTVRSLDTGGGVKEMRLYHDGKLLDDTGEQVASQERTFEKTWTVHLIAGDNLLTATAFSNEMLESRPFELVIPYGQPEEKPDLYFLTVGVNKYENEAYNLKMARPDAETFAADMPEKARSMFAAIHAKQLYDDEASKQGILAALAEIAAQAEPPDVFALYFAGHGVVSEDRNEFYLAARGVSTLNTSAEPGSLAAEGITDQELKQALQKIRALKQVVFLDACHSGTADLVVQAMGASDEVIIKKLSRASSTWVFTAADKQQYALEQTDLGHGLFTYALLKGIAGEADAGARDGYVKLSELETYVADTVQRLAARLNRDQQPKIYKGGDDFSIALASGPPTVSREKTPDAQVASASRSVSRTAFVTGDVVNVRSGPSTSDRVLAKVKQGSRVEILDGPKDTWYKVRANGGVVGWIRGDYLQLR